MTVRNPLPPQPCACGCGMITKGASQTGYIVGHANRAQVRGPRKTGFPAGVLLDPEDFNRFKGFNWSINGTGYLQRHQMLGPKQHTKVMLAREVMGQPKGFHIDHINGDRLDNRKLNLRAVPEQLNHQNQTLSPKNTSGYRGVSWRQSSNKWYAYAKVNKRMISLGFFDDLDEAARVAKEYRQKHYAGFIDR